ncbi:hypothetical protein PQX77_014009 [Marasmius sp. AFHP31]|nr:hypothetical protein PQX77_014009 [Marasmius sp. AFHP31]
MDGRITRKCKRGSALYQMTDAEILAGSFSDNDIITASRSGWASKVYDHYNMSLTQDPTSRTITFIFSCKFNNPDHPVITHNHQKTGHGTTWLKDTMGACNKTRGIATSESMELGLCGLTYSIIVHRTILALWTVHSHCALKIVGDHFFKLHVELLRPGTALPCPNTVSEDVKRLYIGLSVCLQAYLLQRNLGLVIQWYHHGEIFRMILEFLKLRKRHEGQYVGGVIASCLKRYKLEHLLFSSNLDNASSCNTTVVELSQQITTFPGSISRLRCLLHIFNCIAKMVLSFFMKQYKKQKANKSQTVDEGDDKDDDLANVADDDMSAEAEVVPRAVLHQDQAEVKTMKDRAVQDMEPEGVYISDKERVDAQRVIPKVSGFVKRVHELTAVIQPIFDHLIQGMPANGSDKCALSRRVPTRWNSDYYCLDDHIHFCEAVTSLTNQTSLKLGSYQLSDNQWNLAIQLKVILKLFIKPTNMFSQKKIPLVADAIEALEELASKLQRISKSQYDPEGGVVADIIRIVAHGGYLLSRKYLDLMDKCEIYTIALVMSPDKKLQWFKKQGRTPEKVAELRELVVRRWNESYSLGHTANSSTAATSTQPTPSYTESWDLTTSAPVDWDTYFEQEACPLPAPADSNSTDPLLKYLSEPPIDPTVMGSQKIDSVA